MIKNYNKLDNEIITEYLFHPRKEFSTVSSENAINYDINVENNVSIGARFHMADKSNPNIIFFHGNGEIVSDYDDIAVFYNKYDLNFLAVDYRGYGRSTGMPKASSMIKDSHIIFKDIEKWLDNENYNGPIIIMGRSLGSAPALEIASSYQSNIKGIIIESGFAYTIKLLERLGIPVQQLGLTEEDGFNNIEKISQLLMHSLIIHGQYDIIIPISDAETLQSFCASRFKQLQMVPGADHNSIILKTGEMYFKVIKDFTDKIQGKRKKKFFRK